MLGDVIERKYRIVRFVGQGGMAAVYECEHVELGQRFALKTVRGDLDLDVAAKERFLREARNAARVDHPNVVRVVDLGRLPDGRPYLVMDFLEGIDLGHVIDQEGRLLERRAVPLLRQLAAAVDAIHGCGLIHRDLKPENCVITDAADGSETLRIVDFGLVLSAGEHRLTRRGLTVGTVAYMSPEACRASSVDKSTDVYAVGVIAFEILTGRTPFPDSGELMPILLAKINGEAPGIGDFAAEHADLNPLFERVLSRDAHMRHPSAGSFVADLERAIERRAPTGRFAIRSRVTVDATGNHALQRPTVKTKPAPAAYGSGSPPPATRSVRPSSRRMAPWIAISGALVVGAIACMTAAALVMKMALGQDTTAPSSEPPPAGPASRRQPRPDPLADTPVERPTPPAPVAPAPLPIEPATALTTAVEPGRDAPVRQRSGGRGRPLVATTHTTENALDATEDRAAAEREANAGTRALAAGRFPIAVSHFRNAIGASNRYPPAWRGLGLAQEAMRHRPEALRAYRRYLELAPAAPDAAEVRARIARLEGG